MGQGTKEPPSWTPGMWPVASQSRRGLPQCGVHLSTHSNTHDSSCSTTSQVVVGPQTAYSASPLWAIVCPPAASASREHSTHVGFFVLSAIHRVDGVNLQEGWRAETGCRTGLLHPKCTGRSSTGLPQILYTPKASSACVSHTGVSASE